MPHTPLHPDSDIGRLIHRLGHASLIPFVVLALLLWIVTPEAHPYVAVALSSYAAMAIAFLGGIHWGIGLRHNAPQRRLHMLWGAAAAVLAWIAVIMPAYAGLPLQALLLLVCYLVDRKTWPEAGLRDWMTMRFRLTVGSVLACLIATGAT